MRLSHAAALLGLLLAARPAFAETYPTWAVSDETYTTWPTLSFNDGKEYRSLHCRLAECEPGKSKGVANLYTWKEVSVVPIKSTIRIVKDRSSWSPARLWGDTWYTEEEVVDSHLRTYQTELSHYKADMSVDPPVVFQGDKRFPASSSVGRPALSETGSKIHVAPPTKMADDKLVAETPRQTPVPPRNGGNPPNNPPAEQPNPAYPKDEEWMGKVTPLAQWLAVTSDKGTFHCFIPGHPGAAGAGAWLKSANKGGVCLEWSAPAGDPVAEEAGSKYKTRHLVNRGLIYHRGGKVILHMGSARVGQNPAIAVFDPVSFGATHIKITPKPAAENPAPAPFALQAVEQRWLTKAEKTACADAAKAAECRAKIKSNIRPVPDAIAAWETAVAAKNEAGVHAALSPVEMWGKAVSAPVGPAGANAEIQLTPEEYEKLKKNEAALEKYTDARAGITGGVEGQAFNAAAYDPVALHQITEEARRGLPAGPANPGDTTTEVSDKALTKAELDLLTPDELTKYQGMVKAAAGDPNHPGLLALNKELRGKIQAEGRTPYKAPADGAAFNALQNWQKTKFCAELPAPTAATSDKDSTNFDNRKDAKKGLENTAKGKGKKAGAETPGAPAWAVEACAKFKEGQAYNPQPGGGDGDGDKPINVPLAVDKEKEAEKPNPWLAPTHLYNGAKGAILGMIVGSFFGPLGIVLGAAAGAGAFYGLSKAAG